MWNWADGLVPADWLPEAVARQQEGHLRRQPSLQAFGAREGPWISCTTQSAAPLGTDKPRAVGMGLLLVPRQATGLQVGA